MSSENDSLLDSNIDLKISVHDEKTANKLPAVVPTSTGTLPKPGCQKAFIEYHYPEDGLNPELEFEKPRQCEPEASYHVYPNSVVVVPEAAQLIKYNVSGYPLLGTLKAVVDPISTSTKVKIETHYHLSNPLLAQNLTVTPIWQSPNFTLTVSYPGHVDPSECIVIASRIIFPITYPRELAKLLMLELVPLSMSIDLDLSGLSALKSLSVFTIYGDVNVEGMLKEDMQDMSLTSYSGAISISSSRAKNLKASSTTSNIKVQDTIISNSTELITFSDSIDIINLMGSFKTIEALSLLGGAVRVSETILDSSHPIQIVLASGANLPVQKGFLDVNLTNFHGGFQVNTLSARVAIHGTGLVYEKNSRNKIIGYRAIDEDPERLPHNLTVYNSASNSKEWVKLNFD
ncbi:hypothetical protein HDU76_000174 [Blyttiomyces sp. JEL0837]|nr:hypothetical protein HDU76_000174 [Blyttiomyces sp. JEL0837]